MSLADHDRPGDREFRVVRVAGVVLCGGQSTRMGLAKATLPFGSELMLNRMVRLLSSVTAPIAVVQAPRQRLPPLPEGVLIAHDQRAGRGPLEGIYAGLLAVRPYAEAAYVTSCDVPLLAPAFVRRLVELLDDFEVVIPRDDRWHHPLAAVYRTDLAPRIASLLESNRLRPVFLLDIAKTREVPVGELLDVDPELASLRNLNHPQEYLAGLAACGLAAPAEIRERLERD